MGRYKKRPARAGLCFVQYFFWELEAYVCTECDSVCHIDVECVSLNIAFLSELPTEVAYMCNERYFLAECVSDTGLDGNFPEVKVVFNTAFVVESVSETAVSEE